MLFSLFLAFFYKTILQFYNKSMWKMSIQYTVLGLNQRPFERESRPITTRLGQMPVVPEVVKLNPSNLTWGTFFTLIWCKVCLKKTENKQNRVRGWPVKFFRSFSNVPPTRQNCNWRGEDPQLKKFVQQIVRSFVRWHRIWKSLSWRVRGRIETA